MRSTKGLKSLFRLFTFLFLSAIVLVLYHIFSILSIPFHREINDFNFPFSDESLIKLSKDQEIPRLIHQTYSSHKLPLKYATWQKSCIDLHPTWKYELWTDQDLDNLVQKEYPWLWERYSSFDHWINRVDLGRYMILYKYGGFFIDLDVECLNPLERFAKMGGAVFPRMSYNTSTSIPFWEHNFPNSFLGSVPGHIIWKDAMYLISNSSKQGVEGVTGSIFLYNLIHRYRKIEHRTADRYLPEIHLLDPGLIFPYDWRESSELSDVCASSSPYFNTKKCKELIVTRGKRKRMKKAYAVTYWTKIWQLDSIKHVLDSPF